MDGGWTDATCSAAMPIELRCRMDRVQVWRRRLEPHNNIIDLAVARFVINWLDRGRAGGLPAGPVVLGRLGNQHRAADSATHTLHR
jgi:hypothetical protein